MEAGEAEGLSSGAASNWHEARFSDFGPAWLDSWADYPGERRLLIREVGKSLMGAALALVLGFLVWPVLAATPTFAGQPADKLTQALESGDLSAPERAVRERIRIHPGCPRAHLAYASLLAQQGRNREARSELTEAERLEPGLPFASPGTVDELARKLGMAGRFPKRATQLSF
jgi:hypothetical protein